MHMIIYHSNFTQLVQSSTTFALEYAVSIGDLECLRILSINIFCLQNFLLYADH